ncbi:hypothetical protein [Desulfonatronum parangueonense]
MTSEFGSFAQTIQRLEVNHDADPRRVFIDTVLINAADFMRGAQ